MGLYDYETDEELEETKQYWQDLLSGANLEFSPIGLGGTRTTPSIGIPRALVPTDARMAVPDLTFTNAPCHRPLIRMIIQHDGDMVLCCEDTYSAFNLGNVSHDSLKELWYSQHHVQVIEDLLAGRREKYPLCRNCPMSPTGPAPEGSKIGINPRRQSIEKFQPSD